MTYRTVRAAAALFTVAFTSSAKDGSYKVVSPDGHLSATVVVGKTISYSVSRDAVGLIDASEISMTLSDGIVFGENDKVRKVRKTAVDQVIPTVAYKKSEVRDNYNELSLIFKEFSLVFRAYDEGIAYRFVSSLKKDGKVLSEKARFNFAKDWSAYVPYVAQHLETLESQYWNSFENTYTVTPLSGWNKERLAFLPIAVSADDGMKVLITESDLLDYPGMYLYNEGDATTLSGRFAPYPKTVEYGGHNMLQGIVREREDYIASCSAGESFPWRIIMVTTNDADLAVNDMVWKLGTPADPSVDYSWVRPGKVAWDWWNAWNIYGVDFRAGINTETYKYYIDFAAAHGIEYIIMDEGWAQRAKANLFLINPDINLEELVAYADGKNVGIILWASYNSIVKNPEKAMSHYARMGFKGFKIDFINRDDQQAVKFCERMAKIAAENHLLIDFHGVYKPAGIQRTYPNVLNFEGVAGLEQLKWSPEDYDEVTYDVTIPFVRMVAGPMDYTQGAMRNAVRRNYRPVGSEAMSQGTRCRQLAEYAVFEAPLTMLSDSPSNYMAETECTEFIAEFPTVWDETIPLCGEIGEYVAVARRHGETWYVGALTNWDERDLDLDLGFIGGGEMTVFQDGINADRAARDYKKTSARIPADGIVRIHMAPGGGWVAKITR